MDQRTLWKLKIPNRFHVEIYVTKSALFLLVKNVKNKNERVIKLIDVEKINEIANELGIRENILSYII